MNVGCTQRFIPAKAIVHAALRLRGVPDELADTRGRCKRAQPPSQSKYERKSRELPANGATPH
ncbi:hypothetical protein GCM10009692_18950 [Leucobacter aridicollis]